MVTCDTCQDTGLEPIFEHVSFPAHSSAQQQVRIEAFDFNRNERQWTEDGTVHQLLEREHLLLRVGTLGFISSYPAKVAMAA